MIKQWEQFIDKWVGPNLFGGYLAQTPSRKAEAVFRCSLHYALLATGFAIVIVAVAVSYF